MKLGVMGPYLDGVITSGERVRDFARSIERAGAESVWTVEHVVVAEHYEPNYPYSESGRMASPRPDAVPMPDPLELLAFIAACTSTLRLGTAVVVAPLHSPAVLAKRAATLDRLSNGRLMLGLGIGWQKEEYAAVGAPFTGRGHRLTECIEAMRALWGPGPSTYRGTSVSFEEVHLVPKPGAGAVPVVVGGNSEAAIRRAGRLADGWFPFTITPEDFAAGADLLRSEAAAGGRDPESIELTVWPGSIDPARQFDVGWVRQFVDTGACRLMISVDPNGDVAAQVEQYRHDVIDRL